MRYPWPDSGPRVADLAGFTVAWRTIKKFLGRPGISKLVKKQGFEQKIGFFFFSGFFCSQKGYSTRSENRGLLAPRWFLRFEKNVIHAEIWGQTFDRFGPPPPL